MFRTISIIAMIAASAASGAVITVSTRCGTVTGTSNCSTADSLALASVSFQPVYTNSFNFYASESTIELGAAVLGQSSFASVSFQDSYNFTINSGAGSGTFQVCWSAGSDPGDASFSFGADSGRVSGRHASAGGCPGSGSFIPFLIPFTDGVTQTFLITLSASGGSFARSAGDQTSSGVQVFTPLFFDGNGKQLSNVSFVLASTSAPEPAFGLLVALTLGACAWSRRRKIC